MIQTSGKLDTNSSSQTSAVGELVTLALANLHPFSRRPYKVCELDDAGTILVVDSNLQREGLLPSERAFAYKLKPEALGHQGERTDLTSRQVVDKLKAANRVGKDVRESARQVQRYIRLNELIQQLLDMVGERKIAFSPAFSEVGRAALFFILSSGRGSLEGWRLCGGQL